MHVTNIWMHLYYSYPFLLGCWTRDGGISNALRCSSEIASKHPIWIFGILERFEFRLSLQITKVDFPKHGWWHRHVRGQTDTSLKCFNDGVSQVLVVNLNQLNLLFLVLPSFFLIWGGAGRHNKCKEWGPGPQTSVGPNSFAETNILISELQTDPIFLGACKFRSHQSVSCVFFWRKHITTTNFDISCSAWLNADFGPEADALVIGSGAGLSARLSLRKCSWFLEPETCEENCN